MRVLQSQIPKDGRKRSIQINISNLIGAIPYKVVKGLTRKADRPRRIRSITSY